MVDKTKKQCIIKVDKMIDPNTMIMKWICPVCKQEVLWSYMDLVNAGNPICTSCDEEMDMQD